MPMTIVLLMRTLCIKLLLTTLFIAPAFSQPLNLDLYKGKVLYIDFWASWCGPCRESFPFMNEMHAKYAEQGLEIIAINLDSDRKDADKFLRKIPANFSIYYDPNGEQASSFGVAGMPHSFLINRSGKKLSEHIGFRKTDPEHLEESIKNALGLQDKY